MPLFIWQAATCTVIANKGAMFCFCCIKCHAMCYSSLRQLECLRRWTTFAHHVFSTSSTHLPFSCLWTLALLWFIVVRAEDLLLGLCFLHIFSILRVHRQTCFQTSPSSFLPPPLCFSSKILLIFFASVGSGNRCWAEIHFCHSCSVF